MVEDYSRACQKERGKEKKKKKPRKKPLHRDRVLNPQALSPEPSVLSIRPWHPGMSSYDFGISASGLVSYSFNGWVRFDDIRLIRRLIRHRFDSFRSERKKNPLTGCQSRSCLLPIRPIDKNFFPISSDDDVIGSHHYLIYHLQKKGWMNTAGAVTIDRSKILPSENICFRKLRALRYVII